MAGFQYHFSSTNPERLWRPKANSRSTKQEKTMTPNNQRKTAVLLGVTPTLLNYMEDLIHDHPDVVRHGLKQAFTRTIKEIEKQHDQIFNGLEGTERTEIAQQINDISTNFDKWTAEGFELGKEEKVDFSALHPKTQFQNFPAEVLSSRSWNILKDNGIHSLQHLSEHTKKEVLRFRNCGQTTIDELEKLLVRSGLEWKK